MKIFCCSMVLALAALTAGVLLADPRDPAASPELELVAHLALPGWVSNLWVHKDTVYVGNRDGPHGVKLIDIANPAQPTLIGTLPGSARTMYPDLILWLSTRRRPPSRALCSPSGCSGFGEAGGPAWSSGT